MVGSRVVVIALAVIGCGPSVVVPGDTEMETTAASRGDDDGDASASRGDGPRPATSDATGGDPDGGPDGGPGDDPFPIPPDVPPSATTGDVCIEWPSDGCAIDIGPASLVHGDTPLGELGPGLTYGYFVGAPLCDFCVETTRIGSIYFVTDPQEIAGLDAFEVPSTGLELAIDIFEGPLGQEMSATAVMRADGEEAFGEAVFTIDTLPDPYELGEPFDPAAPAVVSGNVVGIQGDGWAVHGQFVAVYCPRLNEFAICE